MNGRSWPNLADAIQGLSSRASHPAEDRSLPGHRTCEVEAADGQPEAAFRARSDSSAFLGNAPQANGAR
jgi:hypothetical protein